MLASQAAVDAIRLRGDTTRIMVEGYNWAGPASFAKEHPAGPWIVDPVGRIFYEAHHYFDCDGSGTYPSGYEPGRRVCGGPRLVARIHAVAGVDRAPIERPRPPRDICHKTAGPNVGNVLPNGE